MGIFYFELSDNVSGVGSYETEEDEKNDTTISSKSVEPSPKSVTNRVRRRETYGTKPTASRVLGKLRIPRDTVSAIKTNAV